MISFWAACCVSASRCCGWTHGHGLAFYWIRETAGIQPTKYICCYERKWKEYCKRRIGSILWENDSLSWNAFEYMNEATAAVSLHAPNEITRNKHSRARLVGGVSIIRPRTLAFRSWWRLMIIYHYRSSSMESPISSTSVFVSQIASTKRGIPWQVTLHWCWLTRVPISEFNWFDGRLPIEPRMVKRFHKARYGYRFLD